jgi:site-specific DNA-methyltransferase (adenine-specific)
MKEMPDESIDLTVTSPPYDNLREYNGNIEQWCFEKFKGIARHLYRITKQGGVVVWVVADATVKGSETGTSFKQALYFKECGFNLHDTMIWEKPTFTATGSLKVRYAPVFEYMFVLSKGKPNTFNPIKDKENKHFGTVSYGTLRTENGETKKISKPCKINRYGQRHNVWHMSPCNSKKERCGHPAPFPEQLANDHIISWSNEGDTVFDCFMGSGTTGKMAILNNRNFIGIELDKRYFGIAEKRIKEAE